jgi:hypothetical protein
MKLLTICMPALMLGAAAFVTPALAQADANASGSAAASGNAAAASPAQPAQDANSAAAPSQTAMSSQSSGATSSGNTQMAMNSTGNASDLSSIPDNQHKYSRAKKASEDRSEDQTTKQLNQQEASVSGASTASAQ